MSLQSQYDIRNSATILKGATIAIIQAANAIRFEIDLYSTP